MGENKQPLVALTDELTVVHQQLEQAVAMLYSPFKELAQSQLGGIQPLRRAAIVLATAVEAPTAEIRVDSLENATLRQKRIDLATALEMLNIALVIHQLLLTQTANQADNPNQRSITGSVILTGDYCFTSSALFAAKTDNVEVVEIFSQTLKTVSEGILRRLFAEREHITHNGINAGAEITTADPVSANDAPTEHGDFYVEMALCEAGIKGAALLLSTATDSSTAQTTTVEPLHSLLRQWGPGWQVKGQTTVHSISPAQQERWQALQQWLVTA